MLEDRDYPIPGISVINIAKLSYEFIEECPNHATTEGQGGTVSQTELQNPSGIAYALGLAPRV